MGGLGLVIGGMIAAACLLIAYWTITAEPPAPDEDRAAPSSDEPHVLVARFQIESTAQLTAGMLLRRDRYLVDPVQVPRRSKAMTWTMLLIALGGKDAAERLGIQEIRDPENPDHGVSLIEADAIPDLVELLEQALATPDALAAALTRLDPDQPDPAAVAFTLGGAPLGEQAGAAEEAAALAVELLRQARTAQDSPQSLYLSYRGEVRAPRVELDDAVLFLGRTGSITTAGDYERIQAAEEAIDLHDKRTLPLRSRTDALATLLVAAQDDLGALEVSPAVPPDPLLGITVVIEPQDVKQVALPALEAYLGERAEALVAALAGDDDPAPIAAALRAGAAPPEGDPNPALDAAALVLPLRDVAQAAADAGEAVYLAYLPRRWSAEVRWAPELTDAQRDAIVTVAEAWLRDAGWEPSREGGTLSGERDSARFEVPLSALAAACDEQPEPEWEAAVTAKLTKLDAARQTESELAQLPFADLSSRLMVRLFPSHRPPRADTLTREDVPQLLSALVVDVDGEAALVPAQVAETWGQPMEALFAQALENVARSYPLASPADVDAGTDEGVGFTIVVEDSPGPGVVACRFKSSRHPYVPTHTLLLAARPDVRGSRFTAVGVGEGRLVTCALEGDVPAAVANRVLHELLTADDVWGLYLHDGDDGSLVVATPERVVERLAAGSA